MKNSMTNPALQNRNRQPGCGVPFTHVKKRDPHSKKHQRNERAEDRIIRLGLKRGSRHDAPATRMLHQRFPRGDEVKQRQQKNPHDVHEVPVQAPHFDARHAQETFKSFPEPTAAPLVHAFQ